MTLRSAVLRDSQHFLISCDWLQISLSTGRRHLSNLDSFSDVYFSVLSSQEIWTWKLLKPSVSLGWLYMSAGGSFMFLAFLLSLKSN